jgi:hypothetical protein
LSSILLPLAALGTAACATPQAASSVAAGSGAPAAAQPANQAAEAPPRTEGMVVVRDPQTGQLRAPTPAEMQAITSSGPATKATPPQHQLITGADGSRHVKLGESGLVYSVVTRDGKGRLAQHCVHGADAAERALQHSHSSDRKETRDHESR